MGIKRGPRLLLMLRFTDEKESGVFWEPCYPKDSRPLPYTSRPRRTSPAGPAAGPEGWRAVAPAGPVADARLTLQDALELLELLPAQHVTHLQHQFGAGQLRQFAGLFLLRLDRCGSRFFLCVRQL